MLNELSIEALEFSQLRGWVVCIEGLIGIGKSTLVKSLYEYLKSHGFKVIFFLEKINKDFFDNYIDYMGTESFTFQTYALKDSFITQEKAFNLAKKGYIVFIDRGIYGNLAFAMMQRDKGFINEKRWGVYISHIKEQDLFNPNIILHLIADVQVALDRVKARNNPKEFVYTIEYMTDLHNAHEKALTKYPGVLFKRKWDNNLPIVNNMLENKVCFNILTEIIKAYGEKMTNVLSPEALKFNLLKGWVICVEGLIGIGKSTLVKSLYEYLKSHGFKVFYFSEKINKPFLDFYLDDMEGEAFSFQTYTLKDRFIIHEKAFKLAKEGYIVFIDRGIYGDAAFATMQFDKKFITERQWNAYNSLVKDQNFFNPHFILHLIADPQVAIDRVKIRNNSKEEVYTVEYMTDLHNSHEKALTKYPGAMLKRKWGNNLSISNGMVENDVCYNMLSEIIDAYAEFKLSKNI